MAEIHVLAPGRDPVLLARAHEMLKRRFEAGEDLGCRIHHLRSLASSIVRDLQHLLQIAADLGDAVGLPRSSEDGDAPASAEAAAVERVEEAPFRMARSCAESALSREMPAAR